MVEGAGSLVGVRVLVVEDDESIRTLLLRMLELEGLEVTAVGTAAEARVAVEAWAPVVALLDLQLPDADGLTLLEELRRVRPSMGCIVVSGRAEEANRVLGLRLGADDYIVKPFSSAELIARVESVVRRTRGAETASKVLDRGHISIDLDNHEVRVGGDVVSLTAKEFALLAFLASSPRQVFTREQLLEHVWSSSTSWQDTATVTEHVRRLRRKLEADGDPPLIETVRGVGYRFTG
ncbi:MAG: response regulator transcription factor [Acidimicrobiales bacterium]